MHFLPLTVAMLSAVALAAPPPAVPGATPTLPASYTLTYLNGVDPCPDPAFTAVSPSGLRFATTCGSYGETVAQLFVNNKPTAFNKSAGSVKHPFQKITYIKDNGIMGGIVTRPKITDAAARTVGAVWMKPNKLRPGSIIEDKNFTQVSGVDEHGNAMLNSRVRRRTAYLWWKADGTTTPTPDDAWLHQGSADGTFYAGDVDRNIIAGKRQGKPVTWEDGRGLRYLKIDEGTDHTFPSGWVEAMSPGEGRVIGLIHVYNNQTKRTTTRAVEFFEDAPPVDLPASPARTQVGVNAMNDAGVILGSAFTEANDDTPRLLDDDGRRLAQLIPSRVVVMANDKAEWLDAKVKNLPAGTTLEARHLDNQGRIYAAVVTQTGDTTTRRLAILTPDC